MGNLPSEIEAPPSACFGLPLIHRHPFFVCKDDKYNLRACYGGWRCSEEDGGVQ